MNNIENDVIAHYEDGALLTRILNALEASGIDTNKLQVQDLAPIEEFHIGGRKATEYLVSKMVLSPDSHVLDIGCGIGGTARYITAQKQSRVTGVDLTPEYIEVAQALSKRVNLGNRLEFETASALALPFGNASFDAVITLHAAMNIPKRALLYTEIARVIKHGGMLCLYDVMKKGGDELVFPLSWAETAATSYLITPEATSDFLKSAGFTVLEIEDRSDFAIEFFKQALVAKAQNPASPGVHLLMGSTALDKFKNVLENIINGQIAPVQILATRDESS